MTNSVKSDNCVRQAMDDEPIDATVGIAHSAQSFNNSNRVNNGNSISKLLSSKHSSKTQFHSNDRKAMNDSNGTAGQLSAAQLSSNSFATAAAALAAAAANGVPFNQLISQVINTHLLYLHTFVCNFEILFSELNYLFIIRSSLRPDNSKCYYKRQGCNKCRRIR